MSSGLDEVDRRLLHALQIEPRASWSELVPVVGVDAATLARRWSRLSEEGIAWITGLGNRGQLALLEVQCDLTRIDSVVAALRNDRQVYVLDHSSGARDLLALVHSDNLAHLTELTVRRLGALDGVRSVQIHLATNVITDASHWRIRALTPREAAKIRGPRPPRPRAARRVPDDLRDAIEAQLWTDGRMPIATIAERTGFAPQRIADAIATLRAAGKRVIRTDIARGPAGWPIYAWYFIEAPSHTIQAARAGITAVPEVRLALTAASRYNLIVAV